MVALIRHIGLKLLRKRINCVIRCYSNRNILKLRDRGLLEDLFPDDSNGLLSLLSSSRQTVYGGFDPTAGSLHIGNLLVLITLLHCQRSGHRVIALVGGATGQVGDPSGRSTTRSALPEQEAEANANNIRECIRKIFHNHEKLLWKQEKLEPLRIVDNKEWYGDGKVLDFVRSTCSNLRLSPMLSRHSVQSRMRTDTGMTLAELLYQAFQAHDWMRLLRTHDCRIQIGGSDQMGNIKTGHDFISKVANTRVYGLTIPLITTEEGDKLGKSAGNTVWLDSQHSSPFSLYQYFLRTKDADVERLLKLFTFFDLPVIESMMNSHMQHPEKREAQKRLAECVCVLVHGEEGLASAERVTNALYTNQADALHKLSEKELNEVFSSAPTCHLEMEPGFCVMDMAMKIGCFKNSNDAHRIINAGGFYINHERVKNADTVIQPDVHLLPGDLTVVRVGKKNYYVVKWIL